MLSRTSFCVVLAAAIAVALDAGTRRITWDDVAPLRDRLESRGITTADRFDAYVERVRESNVRRVREGDLDHLIFYLLQSTRFTSLPPIEPALSAKSLVDGMDPSESEAFLRDPRTASARIAAPVRTRIGALLRALDSSDRDARLEYFRSLVNASISDRRRREAALVDEYLRAMKFVYEKEFMAQRSASGRDAVADLYRTRGLSTDTAVEAGFLVYQGLGVLSSLEPKRRIRRALIVGPGLDLAPRTALQEAGPPESYQPWAIIDALTALGLSQLDDLEVTAVDINPRVVAHLQRARAAPPTLALVSEIGNTKDVTLSQEYRDYFVQLGRAIGDVQESSVRAGHLEKRLRVRTDATRCLHAKLVDIVTERLDVPAFDLVVATNILPYFDDVELALALANVAAMLAPDGVFLHNEARPVMHELTTALRLPVEQSRHAVVASVSGAPALADSVWMHRKLKLH